MKTTAVKTFINVKPLGYESLLALRGFQYREAIKLVETKRKSIYKED